MDVEKLLHLLWFMNLPEYRKVCTLVTSHPYTSGNSKHSTVEGLCMCQNDDRRKTVNKASGSACVCGCKIQQECQHKGDGKTLTSSNTIMYTHTHTQTHVRTFIKNITSGRSWGTELEEDVYQLLYEEAQRGGCFLCWRSRASVEEVHSRATEWPSHHQITHHDECVCVPNSMHMLRCRRICRTFWSSTTLQIVLILSPKA